MDINQALAITAFIIVIFILPVIGLYKMFQKAGYPAWKALVPFLNTWYILQLTRKPKWWFFAQFIPILGYLFSIGIYLEFVRSFGKTKVYQHALTATVPFLYFAYIGFNRKDRYAGPAYAYTLRKEQKVWREWLDAGVFAVVAATIIRTFFIEAYTIPSGSMEGTMLVNDYLFVSKVAYGARMPMTPVALPLVHNTMPLTGGKSYSDAVSWKYRRLPGFGKVQRNDIVVFNFPDNDTAMAANPGHDYYAFVRQYGREAVWNQTEILTRPVDKKENFIKRCIGIPGDQVEIRDGIVYVNGQQGQLFPHQRMDYLVQAGSGFYLSPDYADEHHIIMKGGNAGAGFILEMENETRTAIQQLPGVTSIRSYIETKGYTGGTGHATFPNDPAFFPWNQDNYGPVLIPKKGLTISLNPGTVTLYRRAIAVYEQQKFREQNGKYYINDKEVSRYTFTMDYYWMMGDNRHNSEDSRFWGFVPEDHIVGKAAFVWLSYGASSTPEEQASAYSKGSIRWNRLFRNVSTLQQ